jgi:dTDP-glucose 4,6-dehydratase
MESVLVTGGAGFIGSHFVDLLLDQKFEVICLDALTYAGSMDNLKPAQARANFHFVEGDIADRAIVSRLLQKHPPKYIVNFAAESHVDNSIEASAPFINTNIVGTYNLLECAREFWSSELCKSKENFRYLQISTDEVFGDLTEDEPRFTEKHSYKPSSPYSASKAAADHLARAWHRTYNLPVLITNCSNNYGPRQFPEKLIPVVIKSCLNNKPIPVYGKGANIRDWIHVEDHCYGIFLALTQSSPGETYCFGGNAEMKNIDIVTLICEKLDTLRPKENGDSYKSLISFVTDRPGHDLRYAIDDSKAVKELKYTRNYNFDSGIESTIKWYLEHPEVFQAKAGH